MKKLLAIFIVMFSLLFSANVNAADDDLSGLLEALNGGTIEDTSTTDTTEDPGSLFEDTETDTQVEPEYVNEETDLSTLQTDSDSSTTTPVKETKTYSSEVKIEPLAKDENLDDFAFEPETTDTAVEVEPTQDYNALANDNGSNVNTVTGGKLTATGLNEVLVILLSLLIASGFFYLKRKKA